MSNPSPTVVIVPGAWQPADAFEPFAEQLRGIGHPTQVVPLPSVGGTEAPLAGLKEDAQAVGAVLMKLADEGRDIILLCHSYGGVVGSCATEGLDYAARKRAGKTGGVILAVYMTAFMIPKGSTVLEGLGGKPSPWMQVDGDRCTAVASELPQIALNDMPLEKAAFYAEQMQHISVAAFVTPSSFEPWANGVPCAYIFCELDNALPLPVQHQMAAQLGPDATTFSLKASHCPFLSVPEELRDVVMKASKVGVSKKT